MPLDYAMGSANGDVLYSQMELVQGLLISKFSSKLAAKNVVIIDRARSLTLLRGGVYVELYDDSGTDYDEGYSEGGTIGGKWQMGITLFDSIVVDKPQVLIAATKAMRKSALAIRNVLQNAYEVYAVPPHCSRLGNVRELFTDDGHEDGTPIELAIDLRFQMFVHEDEAAFKGTSGG